MPDDSSNRNGPGSVGGNHPLPARTVPVRPAAPEASAVRRMAAGDQGALAQLVSRYGGGLRSFCQRSLDNAADAEEVVQDVFFQAWREAGRYRPEAASVSTWLYGIAVSRCIDRRRRRAFRAFVGLGLREEELPSEAPDALRQTESRDALERTRAAIAALPARQRMALLLTASGDLDNAGAAAALGIGVGALEQLLVRARRTLRERLDPPVPRSGA
ncbi:RNA polymerase sigma factor [Aureimonas glaciei]|nr:sigma-70 family RNA polymerase sigma factor [Aureimonas glaciei]